MKPRFPFNYQQCESRLTDFATGRQYRSARLQQNTYLEARPGGVFVIRLHALDLITIRDDDTFELNAGEYFTPTTFDRLSAYCPVPIEIVGKEWVVTVAGLHKVPFKNGMIVDKRGMLVSYNNQAFGGTFDQIGEKNEMSKRTL